MFVVILEIFCLMPFTRDAVCEQFIPLLSAWGFCVL